MRPSPLLPLECLVCVGISALIITGYTHGQSIITMPSNAAGVVGGAVSFSCEAEFGSIVSVTYKFNDDILYSYLDGEEDYPKRYDKYKVTLEGSRFTLTVTDLNLEDSGHYTCSTITEDATATLIVLGLPEIIVPEFSQKEGDVATYTCQAYFGRPSTMDSSDLHPQLQMFLDNALLKGKTIKMIPKGNVNSYLLKQIHQSKVQRRLNKKLLVCQLKTSKPKTVVTSETRLKVLYPVQNIAYSPIQEMYEIGTMINASAEGNPQPSLKWDTIAGSGNPVLGPWLVITNDMIGKNYWKCIASNTIAGKLYQDSISVTFEAVFPGNSAMNVFHTSLDVWKIVIAVTIPVSIVIMVVALAFVRLLFQKMKVQVFHMSGEASSQVHSELQSRNNISESGKEDINTKHQDDPLIQHSFEHTEHSLDEAKQLSSHNTNDATKESLLAQGYKSGKHAGPA